MRDLNQKALEAAGHELAKCQGFRIVDEVDQRMFNEDAGAVVTAYLDTLDATAPDEAGRVERVAAYLAERDDNCGFYETTDEERRQSAVDMIALTASTAPRGEPVAWRWKAHGHEDGPWVVVHDKSQADATAALFEHKGLSLRVQPLYAHSSPEPTASGLREGDGEYSLGDSGAVYDAGGHEVFMLPLDIADRFGEAIIAAMNGSTPSLEEAGEALWGTLMDAIAAPEADGAHAIAPSRDEVTVLREALRQIASVNANVDDRRFRFFASVTADSALKSTQPQEKNNG